MRYYLEVPTQIGKRWREKTYVKIHSNNITNKHEEQSPSQWGDKIRLVFFKLYASVLYHFHVAIYLCLKNKRWRVSLAMPNWIIDYIPALDMCQLYCLIYLELQAHFYLYYSISILHFFTYTFKQPQTKIYP